MADRSTAGEAERRRRRLDAVFGDVLPEQTSDDSRVGEDEDEDASDSWLRRQVPPHHGS